MILMMGTLKKESLIVGNAYNDACPSCEYKDYDKGINGDCVGIITGIHSPSLPQASVSL